MASKTVKFKTLECIQNSKSFFVSILPNDVLKDISFVSRRDEDPDKGFQRTLNETRAKDIARYLDELKGTIPSALILSAQDNARFAYDAVKSEISFVTNFCLAVNSSIYSFDTGNYYFSVKEVNSYGNIILTLSFKADSVHKSTWLQMESTIREFITMSDPDETILHNLLLSHFSKFRSEYPSNLRNKLNYQGESSMLDLEDSLLYMDIKQIDLNFIKGLSNIDTTIINNTNQMQSTSFLASYLFELNKRLYSEYLTRSKHGKDFSKDRKKYSEKI